MYIIKSVKFEFDPNKSKTNVGKHGVDFEKAQEIWQGLYIEFAVKKEYENRFAIIGPIEKKLHTCIFTMREDRVRIISCRRSRKKEERLYEKSIKETQVG